MLNTARCVVLSCLLLAVVDSILADDPIVVPAAAKQAQDAVEDAPVAAKDTSATSRQDNTPSQDNTPDLVADFEQANENWKKHLAQLRAVVEKFGDAGPDERAELRKRHGRLVEQSEETWQALTTSAVADYKQTPNDNQEVVNVIVTQLTDDVRNDRYDNAAPLADLLVENNCTDPRLPELAGTVAYCRDDFAAAANHLKLADESKFLKQPGRILLRDAEIALEKWQDEQQHRAAEAKADDLPRVRLKTSQGDIVVELYENQAPETVGNFVHLVERGFYDKLTFHRVLSGFMAQGGCPEGTGTGGPGYHIYCECDQPGARNHFRGTLSMAHAGRDTGGSQFFLTFRRTPHLDGQHTVFGRVIEGLDVLPKLQRNGSANRGVKPQPDKILSATVIRKREHEYQPNQVP